MTDAALIALAGRVREAQRSYFRSRTADGLERSKRLEREFDAALAARTTGPGLFDDPPPARAAERTT